MVVVAVLEFVDDVVPGGVVTLSYLCRTIAFRFICTYTVYQDVVVVVFTLMVTVSKCSCLCCTFAVGKTPTTSN